MIKGVFSGTSLELKGHAGSAPYGQDLVCAGVSTLVYALAQRLTELDRQGALELPPKLRLEPGDAVISATAKKEFEPEVQGDFCLIFSGLKLLEKNYPEMVQVEGGYKISQTY